MAASVRVWFRLEGAASTDFLDVSSNNNVAQLRKAIYAELKAELEPRGITARLLVLSTAGKTYDDEEATVPTVHQTKKDALIVTGTFVRAARPLFAAAYGPRSSCGGGGHPSSSRRYALLPARSFGRSVLCGALWLAWCTPRLASPRAVGSVVAFPRWGDSLSHAGAASHQAASASGMPAAIGLPVLCETWPRLALRRGFRAVLRRLLSQWVCRLSHASLRAGFRAAPMALRSVWHLCVSGVHSERSTQIWRRSWPKVSGALLQVAPKRALISPCLITVCRVASPLFGYCCLRRRRIVAPNRGLSASPQIRRVECLGGTPRWCAGMCGSKVPCRLRRGRSGSSLRADEGLRSDHFRGKALHRRTPLRVGHADPGDTRRILPRAPKPPFRAAAVRLGPPAYRCSTYDAQTQDYSS